MDPQRCPVISSHSLQLLADRILHSIETYFEENKELSDSHLLELHSVYGDITEKALGLLENSVFVCYTTVNKLLKLYQVKGSSGALYVLYPNINFCECSAFKYQVCKSDPVYLTCKHILAAKLAEITGRFKEEHLPVNTLINIMQNKSDIG